jgi:hypothetical protein
MNKELLLVFLFFCHWLGDYTHLSRPSMLAAKKFGKPLLPIFFHALIHAILMTTIIEVYFCLKSNNYNPFEFKYTSVDTAFLTMLVSHFLIDVWKGKMNVWFPKLTNTASYYHWYVFGLDQLLHTIVIISIWHLVIV